MKKIITALAIMASTFTFSQVGIGTNTPSAKSILDLTATDKGFLLPRMTTAQRTAIAPNNTTDVGMQVYDTTTLSIWYWNGTTWIQQGAKNIYDSNGDVAPTATTNRTVTFTNGGSLNFDANTLFVDATNNRVGVGTAAPSSVLSIENKIVFRTSGFTSDPTIEFEGTGWNRIGGGGASSTLAFWGNGNANIDNNPQMFINGANGNVGIGTTTPTERLDVSGKTKTTTFQMTNGASNNFVMTSDASGNGSWQNAQNILVNKINVTPPSGTTTNYTVPCNSAYDIIQITNSDANFATNIFLPNPGCSFAGQKVRVTSTSNTSATISKNNTNTYGTTLVSNGDVYEYTFTNGRWELTSFPTRNWNFCNAPNNSSTTLINPTTPKTIFYFFDGCWSSPITLPSGGSLGDILIIDDRATFNVTINQANTTMGSSFVLVTGSYVQFIKTNLGWVKQF